MQGEFFIDTFSISSKSWRSWVAISFSVQVTSVALSHGNSSHLYVFRIFVQFTEEWYFSIIDIIEVLSESKNARRYWSDLKRKLKKEGYNQLYENIVQPKMLSSDGKNYNTDMRTRD